tara:strand:- start:72 stop:734 length:663 start_codon:yes stop_codon:yes gene_type:complete
MSGIIGSRFNTRGSGLVGSVGTDGQVFTSSGAGTSHTFEDAAGGAWNLISTLTSDGSDSSLSFTSGIDSTYDTYCFQFINIHAETNNTDLMFQVNASGETGFNETINSTFFDTYHNEGDTAAALTYVAGWDQANGTAYQNLGVAQGADDSGVCGYLYLWGPSSTTYNKRFYSRLAHGENLYAKDGFSEGYVNTTAAITQIDFKMSADEIQGGKIKMYGIT